MKLLSIIAMLLFLTACAGTANSEHWRVVEAKFPGVSAMGKDEASAWIGQELLFNETTAQWGNRSCPEPSFTTEVIEESRFYQDYRAHFSSLDIRSDAITKVTIVCSTQAGWDDMVVYEVNETTAYVPVDGVFFKLERIN